MQTIAHYASFPPTGVSLRQMVQFGEKPSTGESITLLFAIYSCSPLLTGSLQGPSSARPSFSPKSFQCALPTE